MVNSSLPLDGVSDVVSSEFIYSFPKNKFGSGLFSTPSHPGSIVGAMTFHYRVRNENEWFRHALTTESLVSTIK